MISCTFQYLGLILENLTDTQHTGFFETLTSTSGASENKAFIKEDFPTLLRPMKHT